MLKCCIPRKKLEPIVILSVHVFLSFMNSVVTSTFVPINATCIEYWKLSGKQGGYLMSLFAQFSMISTLLLSPLSAYLLKKYHLRFSVVYVAGISFLVGIWVRVVGFKEGKAFFIVALVGQAICSISTPFLLNSVTLLSATWFTPKTRGLATALASFATVLGMGASFGMSPAIVDSPSSMKMFILLVSHAGLVSIAFCLGVLLFKSQPTHRNEIQESSIQSKPEDDNIVSQGFLKDAWCLISNPSFIFLFLGFSLGFGIVNAVLTNLDLIIQPMGYTGGDSGLFGLVIILSGLVGCVGFGIIADLTKYLKSILLISGGGTLICLWGFSVLMLFPKTTTLFWITLVVCCVLGLSGVSLMPIMLEASLEATYPINESLSNSAFNFGGRVVSLVSLLIQSFLAKKPKPGQRLGSMQNALWFSCAVLTLAMFSILIYPRKYKRLAAEKAEKEKRNGYEAIDFTNE